MRVLSFMIIILATSCSSYRFAKTDPAFTAVERNSLPLVYLHETPPTFRSVGVIEMDFPQDVSPEDLRAKAAFAGKALGCDVVVNSELTTASRRLSHGVLLVHGEGHEAPQPPQSNSGSPGGAASREMVPRKTFRFNCGLLMPTQGA